MPDLTFRNSRTSIENAIADLLQLRYGIRLDPAAADTDSLRDMRSAALQDRALRFVTSKGVTYRWRRFELSADDDDAFVKPNDITLATAGRWVKTDSTTQTGYLRSCENYNDDNSDLNTFEQRMFGQTPSILLSYEGTERHPKSTEKGALYWSIARFSVFAVAKNARAIQSARQGSPLASEATAEPGTAAMIGDAMDALAGSDLGLNDVAYVEVRNQAPVIKDQARQRFIEVLDIEVYYTETHQDPLPYPLADPFEFNVQWKLADMPLPPWDADNHVVSGLQFPLGDGLTQTFASGSLLFDGATVSITGAAHTFLVSKVTYRDVKSDGTIAYVEADASGNVAAPAFGYRRLGVTVTDASGVRQDRLLMSSLIDYGSVDKVEPPKLTSIALSPLAPSIPHTNSIQFTATGTFEDASTADITDVVAWSSSNTAVATISADGVATTIIAGSTTIVATKDGVSQSTTLTSS